MLILKTESGHRVRVQCVDRQVTRVEPHPFTPLRWWDRRDQGRCRDCYLPRWAHPATYLTAKRRPGDRSDACYLTALATTAPWLRHEHTLF